jgi:hypothetical protein
MPSDSAKDEAIKVDWNTLVPAMLDSPVLIAILIVVLLIVFRKSFQELLASRNVELKWGENHIKLNELSNSLDQELDPLKDQVDILQQRLAALEEKNEIENHPFLSDPDDIKDDKVRQAILAALASPKFRWRSISGLSQAAKVTEEKVRSVIANDDSITIGYDRSGDTLVKLKNR